MDHPKPKRRAGDHPRVRLAPPPEAVPIRELTP